MNMNIFRLPLFVLFLFNSIAFGQPGPLEVGQRIADKIIRESRFDFKLAPPRQNSAVQVVDFRREFGEGGTGVGYATTGILSKQDTIVTFGMSVSGPVRVWINQEEVFQKFEAFDPAFQTLAYDFYSFPNTFQARLRQGENSILIKLASSESDWMFYLCAITDTGERHRGVSYSLAPLVENMKDAKWMYIGPFQSQPENDEEKLIEQPFPPEAGFQNRYRFSGRFRTWALPEQPLLLDVIIDSTNSFTNHSYVEWHYANGNTMLGILTLADETGEQRYAGFVKKFCDFTLQNLDYFKWQYHNLHAFNGFNHRIFRRAMLDDTGAPALPFIELYLRNQLPESEDLIEQMTSYVSKGQMRLQDGTLCRPEPIPMTIWADDLFMSVPFLLRVAKMTGDVRYYDDCALQIKQFAKYLFEPNAGLYYHGWFSPTEENSVAFWGRANGWAAWAVSEALIHLPKTHRDYKSILNLFRRHIAGLARYQDANGMWHQVLDRPEFWEETSCTAMFVLALARGVRHGWLDTTYRENAMKGWRALTERVDADGTVHGICQGTGIGFDPEFYRNRKARDHDPRGLGALLTASVEIASLQAMEDSQSEKE